MSAGRLLLALVLAALAAGCDDGDYAPLIIGHRGNPREDPENSLQGFRSAHRLGADGVELDVEFSSDGVAVVLHDDTLDRTTDCIGPVRERTVTELLACSLTNGEAVVPLTQILPELSSLFELVFVEVKVPEGVYDEVTLVALTDGVIDSIIGQPLPGRFVIISYDHTVSERVGARKNEGIRGGWDDEAREGISQARVNSLDWTLMPMRLLEPWMGDVVHGLGGQIAVYVVGTPTDFAAASRAGTDAMLTDSIRTLAALTGRPTGEIETP